MGMCAEVQTEFSSNSRRALLCATVEWRNCSFNVLNFGRQKAIILLQGLFLSVIWTCDHKHTRKGALRFLIEMLSFPWSPVQDAWWQCSWIRFYSASFWRLFWSLNHSLALSKMNSGPVWPSKTALGSHFRSIMSNFRSIAFALSNRNFKQKSKRSKPFLSYRLTSEPEVFRRLFYCPLETQNASLSLRIAKNLNFEQWKGLRRIWTMHFIESSSSCSKNRMNVKSQILNAINDCV